jgi:hypothetical protein
MRILTSILLLCSVLVAGQAPAISLTSNQLPGAISACANCIVMPESSVDLGYMSVFDMVRFDNNGVPTFSNLVRYNLAANSALNSSNYINWEPEYTHTDYSGYIWMEAPTTLQGQSTQFNIYTDQISPSPDPYSYIQNNTWTFSLNLQATLEGSGYTYGTTWPDYTYTGNLEIIDGIPLCIECAASVRLNLVGFGYTSQGNFVINPDDSRGLLLSYNDYWEMRQTSRDFYVQAVPLPAALWLFITGVISIYGFARKQAR